MANRLKMTTTAIKKWKILFVQIRAKILFLWFILVTVRSISIFFSTPWLTFKTYPGGHSVSQVFFTAKSFLLHNNLFSLSTFSTAKSGQRPVFWYCCPQGVSNASNLSKNFGPFLDLHNFFSLQLKQKEFSTFPGKPNFYFIASKWKKCEPWTQLTRRSQQTLI